MARLVYKPGEQAIYFTDDQGNTVSFECHNDFFPVSTDPDTGQRVRHDALPAGEYVAVAEPYPGENNEPYGTFYIDTGDVRERDIHGGGSGLPDPLAPYQGWVPTYGCLRMQNRDGELLSEMIIAAGNSVPFIVEGA